MTLKFIKEQGMPDDDIQIGIQVDAREVDDLSNKFQNVERRAKKNFENLRRTSGRQLDQIARQGEAATNRLVRKFPGAEAAAKRLEQIVERQNKSVAQAAIQYRRAFRSANQYQVVLGSTEGRIRRVNKVLRQGTTDLRAFQSAQARAARGGGFRSARALESHLKSLRTNVTRTYNEIERGSQRLGNTLPRPLRRVRRQGVQDAEALRRAWAEAYRRVNDEARQFHRAFGRARPLRSPDRASVFATPRRSRATLEAQRRAAQDLNNHLARLRVTSDRTFETIERGSQRLGNTLPRALNEVRRDGVRSIEELRRAWGGNLSRMESRTQRATRIIRNTLRTGLRPSRLLSGIGGGGRVGGIGGILGGGQPPGGDGFIGPQISRERLRYRQLSQSIQGVGERLLQMGSTGRGVLRGLGRRTALARGIFRRLGRTLGVLRNRFLLLAAAAATFYASRAFRTFVGGIVRAGKQAELAIVQLATLFRTTTDRAAGLFQSIREFARPLPVTTQSVVSAFIRLRSVGVDPTAKSIRALINAALGLGRPLENVVLGLQSLETESLRKLGINLNRRGERAVITFGSIRREVEKDDTVIRKALLDLYEEAFGGAIGRALQNFQVAVDVLRSVYEDFTTSAGLKLLRESLTVIVKRSSDWLDVNRNIVESGFSKFVEGLARNLNRIGTPENIDRFFDSILKLVETDLPNAFDRLGGFFQWVSDNLDGIIGRLGNVAKIAGILTTAFAGAGVGASIGGLAGPAGAAVGAGVGFLGGALGGGVAINRASNALFPRGESRERRLLVSAIEEANRDQGERERFTFTPSAERSQDAISRGLNSIRERIEGQNDLERVTNSHIGALVRTATTERDQGRQRFDNPLVGADASIQDVREATKGLAEDSNTATQVVRDLSDGMDSLERASRAVNVAAAKVRQPFERLIDILARFNKGILNFVGQSETISSRNEVLRGVIGSSAARRSTNVDLLASLQRSQLDEAERIYREAIDAVIEGNTVTQDFVKALRREHADQSNAVEVLIRRGEPFARSLTDTLARLTSALPPEGVQAFTPATNPALAGRRVEDLFVGGTGGRTVDVGQSILTEEAARGEVILRTLISSITESIEKGFTRSEFEKRLPQNLRRELQASGPAQRTVGRFEDPAVFDELLQNIVDKLDDGIGDTALSTGQQLKQLTAELRRANLAQFMQDIRISFQTGIQEGVQGLLSEGAGVDNLRRLADSTFNQISSGAEQFLAKQLDPTNAIGRGFTDLVKEVGTNLKPVAGGFAQLFRNFPISRDSGAGRFLSERGPGLLGAGLNFAGALQSGNRFSSALSGAIFGGGLGSAIGGAIGSVGGPLGTIIGTAIGGLLGGIFGGGKKQAGVRFDLLRDINTEEIRRAVDDRSFRQEVSDFAQSQLKVPEGQFEVLYRSIFRAMEEQIDAFADIFRQLPVDIFRLFDENVTLQGGGTPRFGQDRADGLDFGTNNKDRQIVSQRLQDFIAGVPGALTEAILPNLTPIFRNLGLSDPAGFIQQELDKIAPLEGTARGEAGKEFLETTRAYIEAFNLIEGNLGTRRQIVRAETLASEFFPFGEGGIPELDALTQQLRTLQSDASIEPDVLARWKELRGLLIEIPTALSRSIGNTIGQIQQLARHSSQSFDFTTLISPLRESLGSIDELLAQESLSIEERQNLLGLQSSQIQQIISLEQEKFNAERDAARELTEVYENVSGLAQSIEDRLLGLRTGAESPLSPAQQVATLLQRQETLEDRLGRTQSDSERVAIVGQLRDLFPSFLSVGQRFGEGSAAQRALFRFAETGLGGLLGDEIFLSQEARLAQIGNKLDRDFELSTETQRLVDDHLRNQNSLLADILAELRLLNSRQSGTTATSDRPPSALSETRTDDRLRRFAS